MEYKRIKLLRAIVCVPLLAGCLVLVYNMCNDSEIKFSHESGFYDEAFYLALSGGSGGDIL